MTTRKDVRRLIKQTRHKDASLRALAALELGEIGSKYPIRALKNIVPALRKIVNDPDKDVQRSAMEALADIRTAYEAAQQEKQQTAGGKFKLK
ncbi:MAG: HEAT repeat domain-containing protein [Candidatus Helarchaeota archaeon]